MNWYYAINGQRLGPVPEAELQKLVTDGVVKAETLVWKEGMADWQPYGKVTGAAPSAGGAPAADDGTEACVVSGKRHPRREMIQYEGKWISAEKRDEFFQRLREGVAVPGDSAVPGPYGYGGFWVRFLARVLDGLILMCVIFPLSFVFGMLFASTMATGQPNVGAFVALQIVMQLGALAIGVAYDLFFLRKYDATPGKMALGLKVLRDDGTKLTKGRIVGRHFAHIINGFTIGIGYIIAAFDDQKRGLHDRICDTRVIKTR